MTDGRHEAAPQGRAARAWAQVKYRAKAFLAGAGTAVAGEAVVLLTDAAFQQQVAGLVPPTYAFLVPPLLGLVVGGITHQVANAPRPEPAGR